VFQAADEVFAFQSPGSNRFLLFAVYFSKIQKANYVKLQDIHGVFDGVFSLFGESSETTSSREKGGVDNG
jgi:hypothetical protein